MSPTRELSGADALAAAHPNFPKPDQATPANPTLSGRDAPAAAH